MRVVLVSAVHAASNEMSAKLQMLAMARTGMVAFREQGSGAGTLRCSRQRTVWMQRFSRLPSVRGSTLAFVTDRGRPDVSMTSCSFQAIRAARRTYRMPRRRQQQQQHGLRGVDIVIDHRNASTRRRDINGIDRLWHALQGIGHRCRCQQQGHSLIWPPACVYLAALFNK